MPGDGSDASSPESEPDPAPSADLAAEPSALRPQFPLEDRPTGLVLDRTAGGSLHAHWSLTRDDFERARRSFPAEGRRPSAVVRLRRYRADGGSDLAEENPLPVGTRQGQGETEFRVPRDGGHYRAELGLSDGDRGWLMLARSNGQDASEGVALALDRHPPKMLEAELGPGSERLPLELPPDLPFEPALALAPSPPDIREFPQATERQEPPASPRTEPSLLPFAPGFAPIPDTTASVPPPATDSVAETGADEGVYTTGSDEAGKLGAPEHPTGEAIRAASSGGHAASNPAESLAAPLPGIGVRIAPLDYVHPAPRSVALELEAELRIYGRAPPGSEVDLFGHPYLVGPGGRFQLTVRIADHDLLRRALDQAPPPELLLRREDRRSSEE